MRAVRLVEDKGDVEDVVELHHVPVVVRDAVLDLHVGPLPKRGLVERNAFGARLRGVGLNQCIKLGRLMYDVVVDRLHRLHSEKCLEMSVAQVRRHVAVVDAA